MGGFSASDIYSRSKFIDIKGNLDFWVTSPISEDNSKEIISLFNNCFSNTDKYIPQFRIPYFSVKGTPISWATPKQYVKSVVTIEELSLALENIGVSIKRLGFYEEGDYRATSFFEIDGFLESEIYFDPKAIEDFLKGLNEIINLVGEYKVNEYSGCFKNNLSYQIESEVFVLSKNQEKIIFKFSDNNFTVKSDSLHSEKIYNYSDIRECLKTLSNKRLSHSVTTNIAVTKLGNGETIKFFYDSRNGYLSLDKSTIEYVFLWMSIKKTLALSNMIGQYFNLEIDFRN